MNQKKISNQSKLKEELKEVMKERDRWQRDYYSKCSGLEKAEAKVEAYERSEDYTRRILSEQNCREVNRLVEIIRWHINPETSKIKEREDFPPRHF